MTALSLIGFMNILTQGFGMPHNCLQQNLTNEFPYPLANKQRGPFKQGQCHHQVLAHTINKESHLHFSWCPKLIFISPRPILLSHEPFFFSSNQRLIPLFCFSYPIMVKQFSVADIPNITFKTKKYYLRLSSTLLSYYAQNRWWQTPSGFSTPFPLTAALK